MILFKDEQILIKQIVKLDNSKQAKRLLNFAKEQHAFYRLSEASLNRIILNPRNPQFAPRGSADEDTMSADEDQRETLRRMPRVGIGRKVSITWGEAPDIEKKRCRTQSLDYSEGDTDTRSSGDEVSMLRIYSPFRFSYVSFSSSKIHQIQVQNTLCKAS